MIPGYYALDPFLRVHRALQHPWLDLPFAALSRACEGWALAAIAAATFLWLERDARRALVPLGVFWVALAASGGLVQQLKELFATPRPLAVFGPERVRVSLEPLLTLGFPSGHSSAVATFATFTALAYGRRAAWVWVFMLLGGLSRIYVGAHWGLDVAGGWALGALLGSGAYLLARRAWPAAFPGREPMRRKGQPGIEADGTSRSP